MGAEFFNADGQTDRQTDRQTDTHDEGFPIAMDQAGLNVMLSLASQHGA